MLNERKEARFNSVLYLPVYLEESGELFGHLVNISEQGLMIVGTVQREAGHTAQFTIDARQQLELEQVASFSGLIRWCRPDTNPDLFDYGIVVTQATESFRELKRRLLTGFSFPTPG